MTRRIGTVLVALVLIVAAVATGVRLFTEQKATQAQAVFSAAVGLYPGSDVRILGVRVGEVTQVTPKGTDVVVTFDIDGGQLVAAATGAVVIAPSLVSDRYVQLTQPWVSGPTLAENAVIPQSRTSVPVELDQLYTSLDAVVKALGPDGANKSGALSDLITTGAENLEGNGADINKLIQQFGDATGTLSASDEDLFATVSNLDRFNEMLVDNDDAVGQVNTQLATVSQFLAEDRGDLATAIDTLGTSLGKVQGFIHENRAHLRSSVKNLTSTTRLLDNQRRALAELIKTLPVTLQNFLSAYDPQTGRLNGRVDINELSIWAQSVGAQAVAKTSAETDSSAGSSAGAPPPLLLPSVGETR